MNSTLPQYSVDPTTGCWNWSGYIGADGYGRTSAGRGESRVAHRVYYEEANGSIPAGLQIDHLCRNRSCVNPAHLEPVTQLENIRRGDRTKLSVGQVRDIIRRHQRGETSQLAMSREHGVHQTTINKIVNRNRWRSVWEEAAV